MAQRSAATVATQRWFVAAEPSAGHDRASDLVHAKEMGTLLIV